MKIDFICSNPDISIGTYRILIKDLCETLNDLGNDAQIHQTTHSTRSDAVLIYSKGDVGNKISNDNRIIGAISLSGDSTQNFDFSIVNSIEEKKSVEHLCQETVTINLVERMYQKNNLKVHSNLGPFIIGYHGSYTHLSKLGIDGFSDAFRTLTLDDKKDIKLVCVTNNSMMTQEVLKEIGIPLNYVELSDWKFETASSIISQFDVGILPNMTPMMGNKSVMTQTSVRDGVYATDYAYRFKNKSNAGRSFVFIQLGIPVITDLTPSMMPMYFDEKCGAVATNKHTWLNAIKRFSDHNERNIAAREASKRFDCLYNMLADATNLVRAIERIKK